MSMLPPPCFDHFISFLKCLESTCFAPRPVARGSIIATRSRRYIRFYKTTTLFSWVSIWDSDVFIGFWPSLTTVDRLNNFGQEDQIFLSILVLVTWRSSPQFLLLCTKASRGSRVNVVSSRKKGEHERFYEARISCLWVGFSDLPSAIRRRAGFQIE